MCTPSRPQICRCMLLRAIYMPCICRWMDVVYVRGGGGDDTFRHAEKGAGGAGDAPGPCVAVEGAAQAFHGQARGVGAREGNVHVFERIGWRFAGLPVAHLYN